MSLLCVYTELYLYCVSAHLLLSISAHCNNTCITQHYHCYVYHKCCTQDSNMYKTSAPSVSVSHHIEWPGIRTQAPPKRREGHCLRMRETTPGFYGGSYNSVPYRRLYLWTVRERPFYCLGVALRVRPPVVKVYILFSTAVVYAWITLLCV